MLKFKVILHRNSKRPRLASLADNLVLTTWVMAADHKQAVQIAEDIVKEHNFSSYKLIQVE